MAPNSKELRLGMAYITPTEFPPRSPLQTVSELAAREQVSPTPQEDEKEFLGRQLGTVGAALSPSAAEAMKCPKRRPSQPKLLPR